MDVVGFPQEGGFPAEAHRSTVGLRWGLLRRVRYGAVDARRGVFRGRGVFREGGFPAEAHRGTVQAQEGGFPQEGSFPRGRSGSRTARLQWRPHRP